MPKRPRAHVTGDMAQTRVRQCFEDAGHAVNELSRDYGEDLLVRVFKREHATPYAFLVQCKGSRDRRTRPRRKNGVLGYPVRLSHDHLKLWRCLALPVVVTYWDATAGQIFWSFVPTERHIWPPGPTRDKPTSLYVPLANRLDLDGINRIRVGVAERHALIDRQAMCIDGLIKILQTDTPLQDIVVDPEHMIITYRDPRKKPRPISILLLGSTWTTMRLLAEYANKNIDLHFRNMMNRAARNPSKFTEETMTQDEIASSLRGLLRRRRNPRP